MKNLISLASFILILLGITSCGEEIARLPINAVSIDNEHLIVRDTTLELKKGDEIAIWSDMDFEHKGNVGLQFKIEILKNGEAFGGLEIDPTDKNVTTGEVKTVLMGETDWSFSGKNAEIKIEEDGSYTFKSILVASDNSTLKINKAEIVLKK